MRAIRSPEPLLPHVARNRGVEETEAPLLLFTDPDIYPRAGAVDELCRIQAERGGAVVAALACHGHGYVDRGAHGAKFDLWLPRPGVVRAELGPTAGLLVTRADWQRVGGIPGGWLGDTVFSWALAEAGVPLHLAGEAVFEHDHGTTLAALLRERFERGRAFAPLRRTRSTTRAARRMDVAATLTLVRPARVAYRSASAAWRHLRPVGGARDASVVAAAQLAWFAGELAEMAASSR